MNVSFFTSCTVLTTGCRLYEDNMGLTPVIDGYYSDYTDCFQVVSGVITAVSSCTPTPLNCSFAVTAEELTFLNNCPNCITGTEIVIGTQTWTKCNLNVTTYSDGTPILEVRDPSEWISKTIGAWCHYNNDPANDAIYGKMYNWYAVAGIYDIASQNNFALRKSLAPPGYHVPSDAEWTTLTNYLNAQFPTDTAGDKMKEAGNCWLEPKTDATNSSGFSALPGGLYSYGGFDSMGALGYWWTPLENSNNRFYGYCRVIYKGYSSEPTRTTFEKHFGMSVRAIKN